MAVPPVLVGWTHWRLMRSLKALTTLSAIGGPGYAKAKQWGHVLTGLCSCKKK
uniref:Uncharacterized protein n=1 Tax=Anguilla anguilla TaxID=7936 RepID=A0A0E9SUK1_ANGAN